MNRNGWTYKKLVDISDILYGYPFDSKDFCDDNRFPQLIRIRDVKRGFSETYFKGKIPNEYWVHEGDFLIGMDGEFNIAKWGKTPGLLNQRVCKIEACPEHLNGEFLMYFLKGHLKKIEDKTSFVTVKHLSAKKLSQIEVLFPPLKEQELIANELNSLNDSIALLQQQVKDLDALAQSIFYDMFGDPIENPKGWEVKKMSEVGQIIAGSTPSTTDENNWNGDVNWVTPAELGEQLYYGETVRKLTEKGAKGFILMPVGTVLLSSRAPIGKLAITTVPMCCNQGFKNIICKDTISNIFLYYFLFLTIEHVKALGRGATFKEVSKSAISMYKVILPPLSLQQSFATKIAAIEESKATINAQIAELQNLLASRMQYWFD